MEEPAAHVPELPRACSRSKPLLHVVPASQSFQSNSLVLPYEVFPVPYDLGIIIQ